LLRTLTVVLIVAVLFLLGSAFRRVLLYEGAYGFTTARLYAQTYMLVVAVVLIALGIELRTELNASRLFRVAGFAATVAFIVLIYWNHEGWIASRNLDRVAATGKLDVDYLARDLSPNAVPVIVDRLAKIPEPFRTELQNRLYKRYANGRQLSEENWYEYSARRHEARAALMKLGIATNPPVRTPSATLQRTRRGTPPLLACRCESSLRSSTHPAHEHFHRVVQILREEQEPRALARSPHH